MRGASQIHVVFNGATIIVRGQRTSDDDEGLRDRIPFAFCQLLAGFNLRGDGKALALVFGGDAGVDGSVSAVL
jgi:hypothetical protein